MNTERGFRPRALGEIAIRSANMDAMVTFYQDIIGLERLSGGRPGTITFFKIAEGFGGHISVLALFLHANPDPSGPNSGDGTPLVTGLRSSLHHIALSLPFEEQDAVIRWYEEIDQPYRVERFDWIGWRGIFTQDPEGNTVELVAYDAAMLVDTVT